MKHHALSPAASPEVAWPVWRSNASADAQPLRWRAKAEVNAWASADTNMAWCARHARQRERETVEALAAVNVGETESHSPVPRMKADPASSCCCGLRAGRRAKARAGKPILSARYWVFLEEKSDTQVSFSVKIADYQWSCGHADPSSPPPAATTAPRPHRINILSLRLRLAGRLHRSMSKKKKLSAGFPAQEEVSALLPPPERASADEEARPEEFNRVFLTYASERDERFYGFGEQFSCMEFKGRRVPVLVQEQGIGRGDQPITFAANLLSYRSGGNWSTTYAPSPFYLTSKMRSLYLEGYDYSIFDLTKPDRVQIQSLSELTEVKNCGQSNSTPLCTNDSAIPCSVLQDWVGQRKTAIGSQLWWNWEVDDDHYAGWKDLIRDLRRDGMGEKGNARRHLYEEAKELGILVRDEAGEPYMMPNTAFDVAMLDFTNPEASSWFKGILRGMADEGVSGWMADFGEGLPLDARLHSGEDPVAAHNRYPELWARVNREFADEWKSEAGEEDGLVFFVRAGFRESSRWAMLFWEGDQMGNKPGSNCQFYSNSRTLAHFARCAKIYKAWEFYRVQLVKEAAEKGLPVARHLFLHYPEDRRVQKLTYQQFLVGTEMLVVPVLDKGRTAVTAYFPTSDGGSWRHVWTGEEFGGGHRSGHGSVGEATVHGFEAEVSADVGCPAVFVRVGSPVGESLNDRRSWWRPFPTTCLLHVRHQAHRQPVSLAKWSFSGRGKSASAKLRANSPTVRPGKTSTVASHVPLFPAIDDGGRVRVDLLVVAVGRGQR
uniref:Alpha-glucosidase yihQ n=1 Tax=Aegilops tauschii TaxID=37682 RepID=M8D0S1_AEGTA